jgi:hypothetical protein
LFQGLSTHGVSTAAATQLAHLPAVGVLFAAFLGYNPIQQLLGSSLNGLAPDQAAFLTGRGFFPSLISGPFHDGLVVAFWFAIVVCLVAAAASFFSGSGRTTGLPAAESVGQELAGVAGEASGAPSELVDETELIEEAEGIDSGLVLTGRVLGVGGAPIPGAVVTVTAPDGRQAGRTVVRASDGQYAVPSLSLGRYTVIASAPGVDPQAAAVTMADGQPIRRDFALTGQSARFTGSVVGTVLSADGRPLVDATVTAVTVAGNVVASDVSDRAGRYHLAGLPDGEYTLVASQFAPVATAVRVGVGGEIELDLNFTGATNGKAPARAVFAAVTPD